MKPQPVTRRGVGALPLPRWVIRQCLRLPELTAGIRKELAGTPHRLYLVVVIVYVVPLIVGYVWAPSDLTPPALPAPVSVLGIATHNLIVVLILFAGGCGLLAPTLVFGAWNGFLVGNLLAYVVSRPNWLSGILSHGIIEIAGQWCAMVGGIELFMWLLRALRGRCPPPPVRAFTWAGVAIVLTCSVAVVEGVVSPLLRS